MAINNRDMATGMQRETYQVLVGGQGSSALPVAVGNTLPIVIVPFPSQVAALQVIGFGLSGTPAMNLDVTRYNAGGVTTITGLISAYTVQGATISAQNGATVSSGASLVPLQTNDLLVLRTSGANTAAVSLTATLVLQSLADIKTHFNA